MEEWAEVWVYRDSCFDPSRVHTAEGTLEPEEWARTRGVENYPEAIYFFATLTMED